MEHSIDCPLNKENITWNIRCTKSLRFLVRDISLALNIRCLPWYYTCIHRLFLIRVHLIFAKLQNQRISRNLSASENFLFYSKSGDRKSRRTSRRMLDCKIWPAKTTGKKPYPYTLNLKPFTPTLTVLFTKNLKFFVFFSMNFAFLLQRRIQEFCKGGARPLDIFLWYVVVIMAKKLPKNRQ